MAKWVNVGFFTVFLAGVAVAQTSKPALTELQQTKAELIKVRLQLAAKERQLADCTIQALEVPARALESEFLKQVQAEPGATWDWQTMTAKKP